MCRSSSTAFGNLVLMTGLTYFIEWCLVPFTSFHLILRKCSGLKNFQMIWLYLVDDWGVFPPSAFQRERPLSWASGGVHVIVGSLRGTRRREIEECFVVWLPSEVWSCWGFMFLFGLRFWRLFVIILKAIFYLVGNLSLGVLWAWFFICPCILLVFSQWK